jgi:hypothetical protein
MSEELEQDNYLPDQEDAIREAIGKGLICVVPDGAVNEFVLTIDEDEPFENFPGACEELEKKLPVKFGEMVYLTSPGGNKHRYVRTKLLVDWIIPEDAQSVLAALLGSDLKRELLSAKRNRNFETAAWVLFEEKENLPILAETFGYFLTILQTEEDIDDFFESNYSDDLIGKCA